MKKSSDSYPELESVKVQLLVENTARGRGVLGEHGLSWCIQVNGRQLLFDLGQGLVIEENAALLGVDLKQTDALVFSHGHFDHVGGWLTVREQLTQAKVFLHPAALEAKYMKQADGQMKIAGDADFASSVLSLGQGLVQSREPCEVLPGVWMTGEVPRSNKFEDTGGDFYHGNTSFEKDPLHDDQSLFFNTSSGVVVLLGCAHAGVINTVHYVMKLTERRIHAVIGGMHLLNAGQERMEFTIDSLHSIYPDWLAPNHCTGDMMVAQLWTAFPRQMLELHAGQSLTFPYKYDQEVQPSGQSIFCHSGEVSHPFDRKLHSNR